MKRIGAVACAALTIFGCRTRGATIAADRIDANATIVSAAPPQPEPPAIEIHTRTDANDWTTIEVTNVGHAAVALSTALDVEVLGDAGWSSTLATGLSLALDCTKSKCSTLAAGETAHPGQWWGATNGCVQDPCACNDGGCIVDCLSTTAPKGKYRIVARTCDGSRTFASAPFDFTPR